MSNTLDTLINKALETEKAKFSKIEEVSKEDENEFILATKLSLTERIYKEIKKKRGKHKMAAIDYKWICYVIFRWYARKSVY